ncbi:hypothetical protein DFH09DRAFT_1157339 [Mycena vulgaris]|nr:hypothetical protein DFH09DRAFT_1157339 [Mycena vulgaris]
MTDQGSDTPGNFPFPHSKLNDDLTVNGDETILDHARLTARTLEIIADGNHVPFLQPIAKLSFLIFAASSFKTNKSLGLHIIRLVHMVECVILGVCLAHQHNIPMGILSTMGNFANTLQKIYGFLRSLQDLGRIRRFLGQNKVTVQLENCQRELQAALDTLKVQSSVGVSEALARAKLTNEHWHQEVIALIQSRDDSASIPEDTQSGSSISLPLMPPNPAIFHGRDKELHDVVRTLMHQPARVAILGPPGMGKTTLATALLHSPAVVSKYEHHYFISCEGATTDVQLMTTVAFHIGLEPSRQLSSMIVQYFSESRPTLLVLDNLDTCWEKHGFRDRVEDFLSCLSSVDQLSLVITLRGTEHPGRVKWTRPFLPPLQPLHPSATRKIFLDISDPPTDEEESDLTEILDLTGHLPLAASLMASVTSSEGYSSALARWKQENTSMVSAGADKQSNLEKSILVSLTSPRMVSTPAAQDLLSVLSVLPDGLSESELTARIIPIPFILDCKSVLLRTSLAYIDYNRRLKALNPIRDYIQRLYPPKMSLLNSLGNHWQDLLNLWDSHQQLPNKDLVSQLTGNIGNINSFFQHSERVDGNLCLRMLHSIISLTTFSQNMLKSDSVLLPLLPKYIDTVHDTDLCWKYLILRLGCSGPPVTPSEASLIIPETMEAMISRGDARSQVLFCHAVASYYLRLGDIMKAIEFNNVAMTVISQETFDSGFLKPLLYADRAAIQLEIGNHHLAVEYAQKGKMEAVKIGAVLDELQCVIYEAQALVCLGDLSYALQILDAARQLVISSGLEGTDRDLGILDANADVAYEKSDYSQAHRLYQCIVKQTSLFRSPRYHIYASLCMIDVESLMWCNGSDNAQKITDLRERSDRLHWTHGSLLAEIITANISLSQVQRAVRPSLHLKCFTSAQKVNNVQIMFKCLDKLSDPRSWPDDAMDSFYWASTFLAMARKTKHLSNTYQSLQFLGDTFMKWGDPNTALAIFHVVLDGSRDMKVHHRQADCLSRIGDIFRARGNISEARKYWEDSHRLYTKSSLTGDIVLVDRRLNSII